MPAGELQTKLNTLREQLDKTPQLSDQERETLQTLTDEIDAQIKLEAAIQDSSLADNVNATVELFELEHPGIAATLRSIVLTLGNIGI